MPAGAAVLNGAGECTGLLTIREWGLAETPVFLTSTMQVGRVYDAACELLIEEQPAIGTDDVIIRPAGPGGARSSPGHRTRAWSRLTCSGGT